MQLDYKILWVDDNKDWIEEQYLDISGYLRAYGFNPLIKMALNKQELMEIIENDSDYDFIFVDYKFNDEEIGNDLIEQIRNKQIYAHLIFYSALYDHKILRDKVIENNLQGVYVFKRTEITDYLEKILDIIEFGLKKELDLNSMRGIMMAEVAQFDQIILEIIDALDDENKWIKILELIRKDKQRFCKEIMDKNKVSEELRATCNEIMSLNYDNIQEKIHSNKGTMYLTSSVRADFLSGNSIFTTNLSNYNIELLDNFKKYKSEIITERNKLAHYQDPDFPDTIAIPLRKNIIRHRNNLKQIKQVILGTKIAEKSIKVSLDLSTKIKEENSTNTDQGIKS